MESLGGLEPPMLLHTAAAGASSTPHLSYRALQPCDFVDIKAAHAALFPLDYEDNFFHKATNGLDRIWSCAAFSTGACGQDELVGFITAKSVFLHEVDVSDRAHMGLLSAVLDHGRVLYVLTLGVLEAHRHKGIASTLVAMACQQAYESRCRAVFLHVITYNSAAMGLYSRAGFSCVARLAHFYNIATGRQPDPRQQLYDAFLCVRYVGGAANAATPWDMLSLAVSPLRFALDRIQSCVPFGFCRQPQQALPAKQQQQQQPGAPDASSHHSGWASSPDAAQQQQQQQEQQERQPWQEGGTHGAQDCLQQQGQQQDWRPQPCGQHPIPPLQQQQPQLLQQPVRPFHPLQSSRQRHKASVSLRDVQAERSDYAGKQQQQQQQWQQQWQALQQPPGQSPRRMLQWLFNGHSRGQLVTHDPHQLLHKEVRPHDSRGL